MGCHSGLSPIFPEPITVVGLTGDAPVVLREGLGDIGVFVGLCDVGLLTAINSLTLTAVSDAVALANAGDIN